MVLLFFLKQYLLQIVSLVVFLWILIGFLLQDFRVPIIIIKVKINILFANPPPMLVLLVPIALKILVGVLMLLGIEVPIILPIIILKQRRRFPLLLLVVKLLSYSFLLLIEYLYIVLLRYLPDALLLGINFIFQGCLCSKLQ